MQLWVALLSGEKVTGIECSLDNMFQTMLFSIDLYRCGNYVSSIVGSRVVTQPEIDIPPWGCREHDICTLISIDTH